MTPNGDIPGAPLPASAWRLLWAIFITVLTAGFSGGWFIASMAERVSHNERAIEALVSRTHEHEFLPGHAGVMQRVDGIETRVVSLERRSEHRSSTQ